MTRLGGYYSQRSRRTFTRIPAWLLFWSAFHKRNNVLRKATFPTLIEEMGVDLYAFCVCSARDDVPIKIGRLTSLIPPDNDLFARVIFFKLQVLRIKRNLNFYHSPIGGDVIDA